jgi:hypothetical protein
MKEESRIDALEHELKILKNEIHATLLEIREQILNHYYPELRAEEPMHNASLPVRPQVGRPGAPPKSPARPQPQEGSNTLSEIEAKGHVQPFSDIFLEDLEDETLTSELINSRRPVPSEADADLDDDYEDDDNFDDLIHESLQSDFTQDSTPDSETDRGNGSGQIKVQKIVPSPNTFGRTPQTREVDFRQLKQAAANKASSVSLPAKAEPAPTPAAGASQAVQSSKATFAALASWVSDAVGKVGKERTIQIIETYATGGKLSVDTKNSLLQLVSLAGEEEPTGQVGSQEMLGLMVALDQILR